ncbi:MAG TPA: hypothetical protein VFU41_07030 [Gemmatimonadales bacterium]|nr:hypothetical protein [Gemmatimonadales bacterium]
MVVAAALVGCGGKQHTEEPAPTAPLPTAGIAGQPVSVLPLTLIAAEDSLHWEQVLADRRATLSRADSIIAALLATRAPEVSWIPPERLRREARRAAGLAADPDRMGTALLRAEQMLDVPDPLRTQLRTLVALAGGRFAVVPAALVYRRSGGQADRRSVALAEQPTARRPDRLTATAELSVVLVDTRLGKVVWRTVARGDGADPWTALTGALKSLTPGLP